MSGLSSDKEQLVDEIRNAADQMTGAHLREAARARLDALLVGDLTASFGQLVGELVLTRDQMARSSEAASRHDAALVRWTRVLSWATWAYTGLTGGLLVAAVVAIFKR